jgi:thiaminase/transcriptional activator TenA
VSGLFGRLKGAASTEWRAYTEHEFVRKLGDGTLPEASFRHYLVQDYLFLIQFARAWGLAVFKADKLVDIRDALAALRAIVDTEMGLHVAFCREWGIDEAAMAATPEAAATLAYTRFVLERGLAGDLLDLHVALSPCVVGYAEIGKTLAPRLRQGHPYAAWIEMYAGEEYQKLAREAVQNLDRLFALRAGEGRFPALAGTFAAASRLEASFWQMGLDLSS